MFILPNNCCCDGCSLTVILANYSNITLVDSVTPETRETAWALADRPVVGDCSETFHNWNCYEAEGTNTTRTQAKRGVKIVQSRHPFHGRDAFTYCPIGCENLPSRYLGMTVEASVTFTDPEPDPEDTSWFSSFDGAYSVSRTSGCATVVGEQDATDNSAVIGYTKEELQLIAQEVAKIRTGCQVDETEGVYDTPVWNGPIYTGFEPDAIVRMAKSIAWNFWGALNTALFGDAYGGGAHSGHTITINTIGATLLEAELETADHYLIYLKVTLDTLTEYTVAELMDDVIDPAATWVLSNNYYLPWREDGYRGLAPIAEYHSLGPSSPEYLATPTTTIACERLGTIIGQPFTAGWPDRSFDFDNVIYDDCDTGAAASTYGDFNTSARWNGVIPNTATRWTSNYEAGRDDAWPGYGYWFENDELRMQKGQEVLEHYDAFNFFRMDRWLLDTGVYSDGTTAANLQLSGIDTISGSDLNTYDDISAAFGGGTRLVSITGGSQDGEIWYATASGTVVTLVTQLVTDSAEWTYLKGLVQAAYSDAGWDIDRGPNGIVGILRFQYDRSGTQWPMKVGIAGRVAVTASYNSGTGLTTFTMASAQQLITGDLVDVLASDNSSLFANKTWTWVSSTSGTVTGDCTSGAAFLKSSGAPHYLWYDTARYGDFVVQTTESAIVDGALVDTCTNTDANAGTGACPVIVCSPNSDGDTGATVVAFPSSVTLTNCGGRHWKFICQRMVDPVWQEPVSIYEAFTGCPLYVEARVTVRSGTRGGESCPALPANCAFTVPDTSPGGGGLDANCFITAGENPYDPTCNP